MVRGSRLPCAAAGRRGVGFKLAHAWRPATATARRAAVLSSCSMPPAPTKEDAQQARERDEQAAPTRRRSARADGRAQSAAGAELDAAGAAGVTLRWRRRSCTPRGRPTAHDAPPCSIDLHDGAADRRCCAASHGMRGVFDVAVARARGKDAGAPIRSDGGDGSSHLCRRPRRRRRHAAPQRRAASSAHPPACAASGLARVAAYRAVRRRRPATAATVRRS